MTSIDGIVPTIDGVGSATGGGGGTNFGASGGSGSDPNSEAAWLCLRRMATLFHPPFHGINRIFDEEIAIGKYLDNPEITPNRSAIGITDPIGQPDTETIGLLVRSYQDRR
jgi:hypothetical protein